MERLPHPLFPHSITSLSDLYNMKMTYSMRLFATAFLLLMLFMSTDMDPVRVAEARTCESQSHRFKGPCARGSNCASVCQTEGFPGGQCRGFRRRCFCSKPC